MNVRVTSLIPVTLNAFGPHRGSRNVTLPLTSVLPRVLLWHLTIPWLATSAAILSIA
jgi:hypothetical protein